MPGGDRADFSPTGIKGKIERAGKRHEVRKLLVAALGTAVALGGLRFATTQVKAATPALPAGTAAIPGLSSGPKIDYTRYNRQLTQIFEQVITENFDFYVSGKIYRDEQGFDRIISFPGWGEAVTRRFKYCNIERTNLLDPGGHKKLVLGPSEHGDPLFVEVSTYRLLTDMQKKARAMNVNLHIVEDKENIIIWVDGKKDNKEKGAYKRTSITIGEPIEISINGRKVNIRVDYEPDSDKIQIQSGKGKQSIIDYRINPSLPVEQQIPKQLNLGKGKLPQLIGYLKKAVKIRNYLK